MNLPDLNQLSSWHYELPESLIASRPAVQRDAARLMLVDCSAQSISHHHIRDLPALLPNQSRLVFNNTQVLPARLFGHRTETGGKWEGLFLTSAEDGRWVITGQTRGKLRKGETISLHPPNELSEVLEIQLQERTENGQWIVQPLSQEPALELLQRFGTLPLPPYIGRKVADKNDQLRYQTVFASVPGAIAAPTAGLHFTEELLNDCRSCGIQTSEVTLHVGIGTFRPVSAEVLSEHTMHSEWCALPAAAAQEIAASRAVGNAITAVGTTSVRTLEAAYLQANSVTAWQGATDLFIRPGFSFGIVDHLLTNFHLPGSTLVVLVAALAGYELTMEAYRKAVEERYRFYSYGDAMLIR